MPQLRAFTDTIYLSQSVLRRDGAATRYLNLGEALDAFERRPAAGASCAPTSTCRCSWRSWARSAPRGTPSRTRCACTGRPRCRTHLEIETYTWDVLPAHLKTGDIVDYVSRELEFVREELQG